MIVLDANVLVALTNLADAHHNRAERLFTKYAGEPKAISVVNLAEFLVYPAKTQQADRARTFIEHDLGVAVLALHDYEAQLLAGVRARTGLKMPDAIILHLAIAVGGSIMTFDEQLIRAARGAGVEVVTA